MAIPLLGMAVSGLLRRYGFKKLGETAAKDVTARAITRQARKGRTIPKGKQAGFDKWQRARDVGTDALGDATLALSAKMVYEQVKNMPEEKAKENLKQSNPRMYKRWMNDGESESVIDWLKQNQ